jgi:hypothetical protein
VRVLLVDPGSEGLLLSATLRGAGFEVVLGTLEQVPSAVCDVLVIAGDAPGALAALRALRDDGPYPDTKVVLIGAPVGSSLPAAGPAFGADWALDRAQAAEGVVGAVQRVARSRELGEGRGGLRERTLDLSGERSRLLPPLEEREPSSGEIEILRAPSSERSASSPAPAPEPEGSSVEIAFDAAISPALRALLHDADRRVFPHLPPVEPGLPRGEARARELAPEDLVLGPIEPGDEPLADSLTFVGGAAEPARAEPRRSDAALPPTSPGLASRSRPPSEARAGTGTGTGRASTQPKSSPAGAPRREPLRGEGGPLRWLRALGPPLDGPSRLGLAAGEVEVTLVLDRGAVAAFEAPLAARILRIVEGTSLPEAEAAVALARREQAGILPPRERARAAEQARRAVLRELVAAPDARFVVEPAAEVPAGERPLSRRFAPLMCELCAEVFGAERVFALAGGEHGALVRTAAFLEVARECELPLEFELTCASDAPLATLLAELAQPGILIALLGLGALAVRPSQAPHPWPSAAPALRARFEALAGRVEDADYFAVLGLRPDAGALDVLAAHAALVAELERVLSVHRDADPAVRLALSREAASVRAALDEARRILAVDRWRQAHRRALGA